MAAEHEAEPTRRGGWASESNSPKPVTINPPENIAGLKTSGQAAASTAGANGDCDRVADGKGRGRAAER
jgi:hypothetical protein